MVLTNNRPTIPLTNIFKGERFALETYSRAKADAVFAVFKKNHTWQCPTLTVLRNITFIDDTSVTDDLRLKYIPDEVKSGWDPA